MTDTIEVTYILSELVRKLLKSPKLTWHIGPIRLGPIQFAFIEEKTIDERIARIDDARTSMVEALTAINELRTEAETNRSELKEALTKLSEVENNKSKVEKEKSKVEKELDRIRQVMQADISTFRTLAGIPSPEAIKRERALGFATGVLASIVASGVVWVITSSLSAIFR